jgi:hypothetical protein
MPEIPPITPPYSGIRPSKINKDDKPPDHRQQQGNKNSDPEQQDAQLTHHVDEIV